MPASPTLPYPVEFFIAALVNDTTREERIFALLVKHGLGLKTEDRRVLATVGLYWIDQALTEGIRRGEARGTAWNDIAYTWRITAGMTTTAWILFLTSLMCLYRVVTGAKRTIASLRSEFEASEAANDTLRAQLEKATILNTSLPSPPDEDDQFAH